MAVEVVPPCRVVELGEEALSDGVGVAGLPEVGPLGDRAPVVDRQLVERVDEDVARLFQRRQDDEQDREARPQPARARRGRPP